MSNHYENPPEPTNDELNSVPSAILGWIKSNKLVVGIIAGVLSLALLIGIGVFAALTWQRNVRAEGFEWQYNSEALYRKVQTTLSNCLDKSMVAASVAEQDRKTLQDTLTKVIAQRRSAGQEAIPGNASVVINVVAEQYPNVSSDLYKQLMTIVTGCRDEVNGAQLEMQSYTARFMTWTKEGNAIDGTIRDGFPNDELVVEGPDGKLTGGAALNFMATPIITSAAGDASKTKTMPEQTMFPSAPAPTPK